MNTLVTTRPLSLHPHGVRLGRIVAAISGLRQVLRTWAARDRARRELRELDEATLRDVGISRADADYEGGKPFWRV